MPGLGDALHHSLCSYSLEAHTCSGVIPAFLLCSACFPVLICFLAPGQASWALTPVSSLHCTHLLILHCCCYCSTIHSPPLSFSLFLHGREALTGL